MFNFTLVEFMGIIVTLIIELECNENGLEQGYVTVKRYSLPRDTFVYRCDYIGNKDKLKAVAGAVSAAATELNAMTNFGV